MRRATNQVIALGLIMVIVGLIGFMFITYNVLIGIIGILIAFTGATIFAQAMDLKDKDGF
jgi:hypothetical protein